MLYEPGFISTQVMSMFAFDCILLMAENGFAAVCSLQFAPTVLHTSVRYLGV